MAPRKKAPRGYEYKLSCWTSGDFTTTTPEPLAQTHKPERERAKEQDAVDALFWQHKCIWTTLPEDDSSNTQDGKKGKVKSQKQGQAREKSRSGDARGSSTSEEQHILQGSWSSDKISQNNDMITCNK